MAPQSTPWVVLAQYLGHMDLVATALASAGNGCSPVKSSRMYQGQGEGLQPAPALSQPVCSTHRLSLEAATCSRQHCPPEAVSRPC